MFQKSEIQQMKEEIIEYLDDGSWDVNELTDLDIIYIYYSMIADEQEWQEIIYGDYYEDYLNY